MENYTSQNQNMITSGSRNGCTLGIPTVTTKKLFVHDDFEFNNQQCIQFDRQMKCLHLCKTK